MVLRPVLVETFNNRRRSITGAGLVLFICYCWHSSFVLLHTHVCHSVNPLYCGTIHSWGSILDIYIYILDIQHSLRCLTAMQNGLSTFWNQEIYLSMALCYILVLSQITVTTTSDKSCTVDLGKHSKTVKFIWQSYYFPTICVQ